MDRNCGSCMGYFDYLRMANFANRMSLLFGSNNRKRDINAYLYWVFMLFALISAIVAFRNNVGGPLPLKEMNTAHGLDSNNELQIANDYENAQKLEQKPIGVL